MSQKKDLNIAVLRIFVILISKRCPKVKNPISHLILNESAGEVKELFAEVIFIAGNDR